MQTTGIPNQKPTSDVSLLKAANEQSKPAGALISKTVESLRNQGTQTPAQPEDIFGSTGKGTIINTTA